MSTPCEAQSLTALAPVQESAGRRRRRRRERQKNTQPLKVKWRNNYPKQRIKVIKWIHLQYLQWQRIKGQHRSTVYRRWVNQSDVQCLSMNGCFTKERDHPALTAGQTRLHCTVSHCTAPRFEIHFTAVRCTLLYFTLVVCTARTAQPWFGWHKPEKFTSGQVCRQ